jgi:dipeptidyl aminopeptidase/acylaminoacyl peptidase
MKLALRCLVGMVLCGFAVMALAAPVSFADLARHSQYKMVKISPDGSHAAATSVLSNGQTVLTLIDLATMKGVSISARDGDDVLNFWWVSPEYVVYNVAEHFGGWDAPIPTGELYSVRADGSSPTMLFGYRLARQQTGTLLDRASAERGSATFMSLIDGDPREFLVSIRYWGSSQAGAYAEVYRMDVRNGTKHFVVRAPMREARFLADHQGHVRFAYAEGLQGNWLVYMRPADGGDWQLLKQASDDRDTPLAFSADDKTVWFECGASPGFGVCRFDPATGKMVSAWSNPSVEMESLAQGLSDDSIIGIHFVDGRPATALFDNGSLDAKVLVSLMRQYPGEDVQFVSGTADGSKTVALVKSDVAPGIFVLFDRSKSTVSLLAQRAEWINSDQLGHVDPVTFQTRDGLSEQGYVTYPPGKDHAKNLPMVVFVHGGPYGVRDWWEYDPYVQAMATRGYAVLQVNFRGSGGYGFDFEKAGWKQWGGTMQDDVTDATRWAIQQGIADKNRICIYGGSYGGYAALEGAVKVPDLYKCAIGYVGVYDLRLMYTRGDIPQYRYGKEYLKRVLGTDMNVLAKHSPVNQLDNLKAKVMLIVGGRDTTVPPVQGKDMHHALIERGIQHEWLYKSDEAHGFYDEKNIAELFQKVDAFLDANIGAGAAAAHGAPHS